MTTLHGCLKAMTGLKARTCWSPGDDAVTKNITTFNPIRIGYHEFVDIARDVTTATGWRNKLRYVFGRPGWQPSAN